MGSESTRERLKHFINFSDNIDMESARNNILGNIEFRGSNVWILIFAMIIASVGLNVNSIPVVIGAMLISPLMGPIIGVGFALAINDTGLLRRSSRHLGIMALLSILSSTFYFLLTPLSLNTPTELLARTNPTFYDVFIAFFGGLAVSIEICKKDKCTVIAGVAIATALMPPLCTAGFGLACGNMRYFIGAIYLFFINSVFIALASFLMLRYLKFPIVSIADPVKKKRTTRIIAFAVLLLIVPSIYSAISVIQQNKFNKNATKFINENKTVGNAYIFDYDIDHSSGRSKLIISLAGQTPSEKELAIYTDRLANYDIKNEQFEINSSSTVENNRGIDQQQLVNSIYSQNENEIRKRETTIAEMERQLAMYKKREYPTERIFKELKINHPDVTSLTICSGETAGEDNAREQGKIHFFAILGNNGKALTADELEHIKIWLEIRMSLDEINVIQK